MVFSEVFLPQNKIEDREDSVNKIVSVIPRERRTTRDTGHYRAQPWRSLPPGQLRLLRRDCKTHPRRSGAVTSAMWVSPTTCVGAPLTPAPEFAVQIPVSRRGTVEICSVLKFIMRDISLRMRSGTWLFAAVCSLPRGIAWEGQFPLWRLTLLVQNSHLHWGLCSWTMVI